MYGIKPWMMGDFTSAELDLYAKDLRDMAEAAKERARG